LYNYTALDCRLEGTPSVQVSSRVPKQVGGDCDNCNDCIQAFILTSQGQARSLLVGPSYLKRGAFRKGVPCPHNPFHKLDEYYPADNVAVLAEYTAEYKAGRNYLVRLFTLGVEAKPVLTCHLGWELDRKSPPSPFFVPHLSKAWISTVTAVPGGHIVEVDQIGEFHVATLK
jgi:hypothetical protein